MVTPIPLALQSAYADLLDRAANADFQEAFGEIGTFVVKTIRGRRYWYLQRTENGAQHQQYAGPESPELLKRIAERKAQTDSSRDRRTLVATLRRSANLPAPPQDIGNVIAALASAGVFRLRGVLVGTAAYQVYSAMLGVRLPHALSQTGDIDIAQFSDVSVAVQDQAKPPILEALRVIDRSFEPVPHPHDGRRSTTYASRKLGLRVDFLTPNTGPETEAPRSLPALGTDADPLLFLDFLIHDAEPAVILHGAGVFVHVPSPFRFAIHKLIVAGRRALGSGKIEKDLAQAQELLRVLSEKRPAELEETWRVAFGRGKKWQSEIGKGLGRIDPLVRDSTLKAVGMNRKIVPNLRLEFKDATAFHDPLTDTIVFMGDAGGSTVRCAVSRVAVDDNFGCESLGKAGRMNVFRKNRGMFEAIAIDKFLNHQIEKPGEVLIKGSDVVARLAK